MLVIFLEVIIENIIYWNVQSILTEVFGGKRVCIIVRKIW